MRTRHWLALFVLVLSSANLFAAEQEITADKKAQIDKLLTTTGALQLGQQLSSAMITQLTATLRATHANIPQKALDILPVEVNAVIAEHIGELRDTLVHIYGEHFTLEELKGLNRFYESDLGQKVVKTLPDVVRESMLAGQKWGMGLGPEIARRIQSRFQKENIAL